MSIKKIITVGAVGGLLVAGLAGCGNSDNAPAPAKDDKASSAPSEAASSDSAEKSAADLNQRPEECSLQEQAGPAANLGPFQVELHYFQPAVMAMSDLSTMKMGDYDKSQMHFELDTKATPYGTNWGYSVDETPANLTVMYKLDDPEGKQIASGMMMEMNAIDGSHYGTNLPKDTVKAPGKYKLTVTLYPPKNYGLHQDYITGAPARGWFKPLTAAMDWDVTQANLDAVKNATVADPMSPSDKCKGYPVKTIEDPTAAKAMEDAEGVAPLPMDAMSH